MNHGLNFQLLEQLNHSANLEAKSQGVGPDMTNG